MYEVVIIGAGPAGISAGIQLKKLGIDAVLIEKAELGGLIKNANLVENLAGTEQPLTGTELTEKLKLNVENWNLTIIYDRVVGVSMQDGVFEIFCAEQTKNLCVKALIFAVGTSPVKSNLQEANNLFYDVSSIKKSISKAAVIGGGEAAFDYAMSLTAKGAEVDLYIRLSKARVKGRLKEAVEQNSKINTIYNQLFDQSMMSQYDAVVSATGRKSAITEIETNFDLTSSSAVFIAGDARLGSLGQFAIAIGDGLYAATLAAKYLEH